MVPENLVINTHELSKSFGDVSARSSLDLKVPKNSIFCFLGPNGAGKKTAIRILTGMMVPTSGYTVGAGILPDHETCAC